jgi:hypothetical protein
VSGFVLASRPNNGVKPNNTQEIISLFENLSEKEKQDVLKELLRERLTIVLGGNNVICNSTTFQLNGVTDEMGSALENIPPEAISELLKAVAEYVTRRKC